ncbi:MAG: D-alanine--D-alanine ligase [Porticoccaceae bacterium]|jgi:D-alanine-D-alanine ligase|nr:D-alanine--D-alanine ligase [Porticoccaceae bacterium]
MSLLQRLEQVKPADLGFVAVLYGGESAEREISLQSGRAVADALQQLGIRNQLVDVGPDVVAQLQQIKPDLVFIALHGRGGEDGSIQGVLEFLKIPYTGSGVLASALTLHKAQTKRVWEYESLPTAPWSMLDKNTDWSALLAELGGHVMVKPVSEGSSLGMSQAKSAEALEQAYKLASQFDLEVMAEQWISGSEYTVGLLQGEVMPVIEMKTSDQFYTYEAKYLSEETSYLCPAPISEKDKVEVQDIALRAFNCLGCRGWGRVDLMRAESGQFLLLEANTIPGLTSHSLVPMAAAEMGISFPDLILLILDFARSQR